MPFELVPAGSFLMGSDAGQDDERPVHRVLVEAFEMSRYPVTRRRVRGVHRRNRSRVPA